MVSLLIPWFQPLFLDQDNLNIYAIYAFAPGTEAQVGAPVGSMSFWVVSPGWNLTTILQLQKCCFIQFKKCGPSIRELCEWSFMSICINLTYCAMWLLHSPPSYCMYVCITWLVLSSIWPGVQKWSTSLKLSCLFLKKTMSATFHVYHKMQRYKCPAGETFPKRVSLATLEQVVISPLSLWWQGFLLLSVYPLQYSSLQSFSQARWVTCLAVRGTKKAGKKCNKTKNSLKLRKIKTRQPLKCLI